MEQTTNLRAERKLRGWSLVRLSAPTLIAPSDLSRLERKLLPAYPSWRRRLAKALQVREAELFADRLPAHDADEAGR